MRMSSRTLPGRPLSRILLIPVRLPSFQLGLLALLVLALEQVATFSHSSLKPGPDSIVPPQQSRIQVLDASFGIKLSRPRTLGLHKGRHAPSCAHSTSRLLTHDSTSTSTNFLFFFLYYPPNPRSFNPAHFRPSACTENRQSLEPLSCYAKITPHSPWTTHTSALLSSHITP